MDHGVLEMKPRLRSKWERFEREGKLRIGFLGASLTHGEWVAREKNFVSCFAGKINEIYRGRGRIEVLPFGESGTRSSNALFKVDRVLQERPDIVFLDFSMNDDGERYMGDCFEGLVRRMLCHDVAVVILLFCNNRGNCTRGALERVGHCYRVPVFDIGKILYAKVQEGMPWEMYAQDYVHPTEYGHAWIADRLCEYMGRIERGETEDGEILPEQPVFTGAFFDYDILDFQEELRGRKPGDIIFSGKLFFRMLLTEFVQDKIPNPASIEVWIDDRRLQIADAFAIMAWGNKVASYLLGEGDLEEHELRIVLGKDRPKPGWDYADFQLKLLLGK